MHAEFESMRAYMLAAQEQASAWLKNQVEVTDNLRTFVCNLEALLCAHGLKLRLNSQRHHSTVCLRRTLAHSGALYHLEGMLASCMGCVATDQFTAVLSLAVHGLGLATCCNAE